MCRENPCCGAPRIHGELLKLGIDIGEGGVFLQRRSSGRKKEAVGNPANGIPISVNQELRQRRSERNAGRAASLTLRITPVEGVPTGSPIET